MKLAFNNKVNVYRPASVSDGAGTFAKVDVMLHYELPCRIGDSSGSEARTFGREANIAGYYMLCSIVDLDESDIVVDGSIRYEILRIVNRSNRYLLVDLGIVK